MFGFLKLMKERNFLLLVLNTAFWAFNMTVGRILLSWLVLDSTNSPALLGVSLAARFAPMILGAVLGTLVDRFSRRKLLFMMFIESLEEKAPGFKVTLSG